jgi:hypothetical protein
VSDLLLSPEERERFAAWLHHEAMTDRQLADQLDQIGHPRFAASKRSDANAKDRVAELLRSTEDMSL